MVICLYRVDIWTNITMWRTSEGERILQGAEALLFAEALWDLIDETNLSDDNDYVLGIHSFDRLTYGQKISALSIVGKGLLQPVIPPIPLTSVLEATIAVIFQHLKYCIVAEIEEPQFGTTWRRKIVSAREESGGEEIPSSECPDMEEWGIEVDSLEDYILWDADYQDEDFFIDDMPEKAELMKKMMGVSKEYYTDIMDDLSDLFH